MAGYYDIMG